MIKSERLEKALEQRIDKFISSQSKSSLETINDVQRTEIDEFVSN